MEQNVKKGLLSITRKRLIGMGQGCLNNRAENGPGWHHAIIEHVEKMFYLKLNMFTIQCKAC